MLKRYVRDLLVNPILAPAVRLLRAPATILLLHRFEDGPDRPDVMTTTALRAILGYLRRERIQLLSLQDVIARVNRGENPPANSVAFTVDDGYADFADVAVPVFAEFDCPVTVFVTTGPVDRTTWFWWDRLMFAFENASGRVAEVEVAGRRLRYTWPDRAGAQLASQELAEELKLVSNAERLETISAVSVALGVDTECAPPPEYAAMTWEAIRALANSGLVDVGPHTVTHPILSRLMPDEMHFEIHESHRRLREMYPATLPIFAYPNGLESDYTPQVLRQLREEGFAAAVTTAQRHVGRRGERPNEEFLFPRFGCPTRLDGVIQVVSGIESLKNAARRTS